MASENALSLAALLGYDYGDGVSEMKFRAVVRSEAGLLLFRRGVLSVDKLAQVQSRCSCYCCFVVPKLNLTQLHTVTAVAACLGATS
jgi:hypothetical protein